jgi:hypothetical protein
MKEHLLLDASGELQVIRTGAEKQAQRERKKIKRNFFFLAELRETLKPPPG